MSYAHLFSPKTLGMKTAPNRFVCQAMEGNDGGPGGGVSERTLNRYKALAEGGWGVVVVEAVSVTRESIARKNGLVMSGENLDGFKRLVSEFKHINPDAVLLLQITHSGRHSGPFSVKTCLYPEGAEGAHLLTTEEIEAIRKRFAEAAFLAEKAGADGIDFKLCHGYFGAEMLRPGNVREDRWGGSLENRTRFIRETVEEIRAGLKTRTFILGSRISMYEAVKGGCGTAGKDEIVEDLSEMKEVLKTLERIGMSYVNVSAGIPAITAEVTRPTNPSKYLYLHHLRYARLAKKLLPGTAVVGSAYSILKEGAAALGEENVAKGYADFIGFGRQSFADPLYPKKLAAGEKINYCTACSGCSKLMANQVNDGCIVYDEYYRDLFRKLGK